MQPFSLFPRSVTRPIVPSAQCVPKPVENDEIMACICTDDFCNGLDGPTSTAVRTKKPPKSSSQRKTTSRPKKRPQSGSGGKNGRIRIMGSSTYDIIHESERGGCVILFVTLERISIEVADELFVANFICPQGEQNHVCPSTCIRRIK